MLEGMCQPWAKKLAFSVSFSFGLWTSVVRKEPSGKHVKQTRREKETSFKKKKKFLAAEI